MFMVIGDVIIMAVIISNIIFVIVSPIFILVRFVILIRFLIPVLFVIMTVFYLTSFGPSFLDILYSDTIVLVIPIFLRIYMELVQVFFEFNLCETVLIRKGRILVSYLISLPILFAIIIFLVSYLITVLFFLFLAPLYNLSGYRWVGKKFR